MAALHTDVTEVGGVAERARARELILSHYLPADPEAITDADWAKRAGQGFSGKPPRAATACAERSRALLRDHCTAPGRRWRAWSRAPSGAAAEMIQWPS